MVEEQLLARILFFAESIFFQTGKLPSHEVIEQTFLEDLPEDHLLAHYLIEMHKHFETTGLLSASESLLSPKQYLAARMLLNTTDRRSLRTKLKELNITPKEFDDWRYTPRFINYLRQETAKRFKNADVTADLELVKNIEDGDLKSIMYYNQMTGRSASPESLNVQRVLATMMEILVKYVTSDVLSKVAKELESKLAQHLALQLESPPRDSSLIDVTVTPPVEDKFFVDLEQHD